MPAYSLRRAEKSLKEKTDSLAAVSEALAEIAGGVWECVKCGAVVKTGVLRPLNRRSAYRIENNPSGDSNKKKKLSRWVI